MSDFKNDKAQTRRWIKILICLLFVVILFAAPGEHLAQYAAPPSAKQDGKANTYGKITAVATLFRPTSDSAALESTTMEWDLYSSTLFAAWRRYAGLSDDVAALIQTKSEGYEFTEYVGNSAIIGHRTVRSWIEIDLSAEFINYLEPCSAATLVESLKQTLMMNLSRESTPVIITIEGVSIDEYLS